MAVEPPVKAAAARLGHMRLSLKRSRDGLNWISAILENVSLVEFPPGAVPDVTFDRLNEHYREVVALARLVLRHVSFEATRGGVRAQGFLIDMKQVFQDFVTRALREQLRLSPHVFRSDTALGGTFLDEGSRIRLRPIYRGGKTAPAPSLATQSTSGSSTPACPTPTSISFLPMRWRSTCRAGCSSTHKGRRNRPRTGSATPANA